MAFLRRESNRYSKFGVRRKKMQKWRKPTGRDNKMREKRKGYPKVVSVGYRTEKAKREEITPVIRTIKDLEKIRNSKKVILGNIGKKKKIEIMKKAKEMKIEIDSTNIDKFIKKNEKKKKKIETKEEKPKEKKK